MEFEKDPFDHKSIETTEDSQPTTNEPIEQQHLTELKKEAPQEHFEETEETTNVIEKLKEINSTSSPPKYSIDDEKEFRRKVESVKNPFKNLTPRVTQLIYWENPTHSGAILAIGVSFLIYTTYCSLFNTFCALAFILLGANWIYVIGRKQLESLWNQKPVNPYEHLMWYIEREEAEKYLDITIEAVNFVLLEVQRIVLVDDPMRTVRYGLAFYVLWTLGTWFNLGTLVGIGLVLGFVAPISYQKNKVLVDEKLDQLRKFLHCHFDRSLDIAKQHTGGVYEKAKSFVAEKGLINAQNTKKEE